MDVSPVLRCAGAAAALLAVLLSPPRAGAQQGRVLEGRSFRSESLDRDWAYSVYLPPGYEAGEQAYPTVYLLHGYGGDHTNWVRMGDAAITADSLIAVGAVPPLILVMPDGRDSFYVDSDPAAGFGAVETALVRDLVAHVDATWRTIAARRARMIAGLSMGGYGAVHLAFKYPEVFGAAASLSGTLARGEPGRADLFAPAFGDPFDLARWEAENPFGRIARVKESGMAIPVYLTVGDDDAAWFYQGAVDFYVALKEAEMPAELRVTNGAHTWEVWDRGLREVLHFFADVFRARYR
jgi:enterochelin esterase family protein